MPNVVRNGDSNVAGGIAVGGASTVFVNGKNVMLPNKTVMPHPCYPKDGCSKHGSATTQGGSSTVFAEGQPIIHVNDSDTCGHKRCSYSQDVVVGE